MKQAQFTRFDALHAMADIESLARRQCPGLLEQYRSLHIPMHTGRIAYLGAGHDFLLPHTINKRDNSTYRFKLVDDYQHDTHHDYETLSEFLEEGWMIVVAENKSQLEKYVRAAKPQVIVYRASRKDYANTVGKHLLDMTHYIITDDELEYKVVGESDKINVPDLLVPGWLTPAREQTTLPVSKQFYTYKK